MPHDDDRYFTGALLDAAAFELEQEYRRQRPRGDVAIVVEIDTGGGFELWEEVVDFTASGSDDRHFVFDLERGIICFGDGRQGRRPPAGSRIRGRYRRGGGSP